MVHVFSEIDRLQAHGHEAQAKRRATMAERSRLLREDVALLWRRGLVPLAIADTPGVSVTTVSRFLRQQGVEIPAYLTIAGPKARPTRCPHCGDARRPILHQDRATKSAPLAAA